MTTWRGMVTSSRLVTMVKRVFASFLSGGAQRFR